MDLLLAFYATQVSDMRREVFVLPLEAGAVTARLVYPAGWLSAVWICLRS